MPAVDGVAVLDDLAVVRVEGTDSREFLGRQLTCDVESLAPDSPRFGAWLSPKGRALCLLHLLDAGDGTLRAVLPRDLIDETLRRLRMFVMRDDVSFSLSEDEQVLGLSGRAPEVVGSSRPHVLLASLPSPQGPTVGPLAIALCPADEAPSIEAQLQEDGCESLQPSQWTLLEVNAGLPQVLPDNREAFIPQMINLDLLDAVSFSKGCYPGQEIVARTQHLGRIKRRAYIARCEATEPPARAGDVVVSAEGADTVGRVVHGAVDGDTQAMLVVVPLEAASAGRALRLFDASGPTVTLEEPAYLADTATAH